MNEQFSGQVYGEGQEDLFKEFGEHVFPHLRETMEGNLRRKFGEGGTHIEEFVRETIEEELPRALQNEKEFSEQVLRACARWAKEKDPIVLWDVDDTMGKYWFGPRGMVWGFRPIMLPLFDFLKEKFPNLIHGILSSRAEIQAQLDDPQLLWRVSSFIRREHIYSSRDKHVSPSVEECYYKAAEERDIIDVTPAKAEILRELRESGKNVKSVDDDGVAALSGDNGVYVYKVMPNEYFCV